MRQELPLCIDGLELCHAMYVRINHGPAGFDVKRSNSEILGFKASEYGNFESYK